MFVRQYGKIKTDMLGMGLEAWGIIGCYIIVTHASNLPSIFDQGRLQSHLSIQQQKLLYHDVANRDVQSRRKKTKIIAGMGGNLHDYVPFYFASRSPMLFYLHKQKLNQEDVIYFMTNIQSIVDNKLS